ncbi:MAG TPA: hypothetical protein VJM12_13080 [Pyrinomonadaceae bacterium]|nr:hypothetical protein [Pyrinomonadaceae bacterium]
MKTHSPDNTKTILADTSSAASQLHAEIEEMRRRLAALEARAPAHANQTVGRKRHWHATPKRLALMIAGVMLVGATIVFGQSAVDALFVDKNGNVGIGTTAPANKLSVMGNADFSGNVAVGTSTPANKLSVTGNADFSGNVGIGTTAPAAKLDIKDRIALQDASGRNYFKDFEKNDGKGLRVGTVWGQYGVFAETGLGALGGVDGVTLQNGGLKVDKAGVVSTSSDMSVGRFVRSKGRYQRDSEAETTYSLSPRYHLSLTAGAFDGTTKLIPQDVIDDLCGDWDGCEYRLGMTRWSDDTQTETASRSGLFYYSTSDGHWRSSEDQVGVDGNRITEHVKYIWETCYFTDAPHFQRTSQRDEVRGMYLLVWYVGFSNKNRTCELTLID